MPDPGQVRQDIPAEAFAEELGRLCESRAFRHSLRQQRFLKHLLERKAAGDLGALTAAALAIDFFRKSASSYDPKTDAVVRIEAGRLRQRLERYYAEEGQTAVWEISLDRGSYLPRLRRRDDLALDLAGLPGLALRLVQPEAVPGEPDFSEVCQEIEHTLRRLPTLRAFRLPTASPVDWREARREARQGGGTRWVLLLEPVEGRGLSCTLAPVVGREACHTQHIAFGDRRGLELQALVRRELLRGLLPKLCAEPVAAEFAGIHFGSTVDPKAYDAYLRARYMLKQRHHDWLAKGIKLLEEATQCDPQFADAWAELAAAQMQRRHLVFDPGARDSEKAIRAARQAIELHPGSGKAHATLARIAYINDFDWAEADRLFQFALQVTPRDHEVRGAYASFLVFSARFEEALREFDVLRALNPLDLATRSNLGALFFYWRDFERAAAVLQQTVEIAPQDIYALLLLADALAALGDAEGSLAAAQQMLQRAPDYANSYVYLARALHLLGQKSNAERVMGQARQRFNGVITGYEEAMLAVASGDLSAALGQLGAYASARGNGAHCIPVDPSFARLHALPGWAVMLQKAGLPDFSERLAKL